MLVSQTYFAQQLLIFLRYSVSYVIVGDQLKPSGFGLQAYMKTQEGGKASDRNKQFEFINKTATAFMNESLPVISVDCTKKELIGKFKNRVYRPDSYRGFLKGKVTGVNLYDFIDSRIRLHGM